MTIGPDYRPPWWYRGRHLQTLWGPLLRRGRQPPFRRERVETPDGDFLDLDWLASCDRDVPLAVILHGLEGSSRSHYVSGLLREIDQVGWRGLVVNFRSCSGEVNRSRRMYHSGETEDLDFVLGRLTAGEPKLRLGLVGVSLGGNVALKWLAEHGDQTPAQVAGAVAISTPFDLAACAAALDRGLNRALYTANFLSTMKIKLDKKAALYEGVIDLPAARKAKTFAQYDRLVTAPLGGFANERDYWVRSSSGPLLPRIRRPTLLINAVNDPFIPASALPRAAIAKSRWLEAAFVPEGGHAGFLEGPLGARSWAEARAVEFLRRHLLG
ncbi:MAG: alpha/beta fold hydrolase [Candidatus Rokubacteria bacterium]|nr:alpha/beta fold hydrolase [Candidatus Rokubacteria bacterium]